jgi:ubiquinone/menaquinone biosynthesis C-methylase UbiE
MCPVCGSLERHRLDWIFFARRTDIFDGTAKMMLHIAPEEFLSARFSAIDGLEYVSADLHNPRAMLQMDITDIDFPDDHFSVIYCSHVLEHVPDDRKALAELYRVLRPGGWAALQVPVSGRRTYENRTIIAPEDRQKHFGHREHVRRCGRDYVKRMRSAGFVVEVLRATDVVTEEKCARMGFRPGRIIYFCRKPQRAAPRDES